MKPGLNLSKRQRIIAFYIIGLILPGILLGFFAFRGLRNDQALREKQNQQELKLLSVDVFSELDKRMALIQEDLSRNPNQENPLVLIAWETEGENQTTILQSQMLYWPDDRLAKSGLPQYSPELERIQRIEFSQKDYPNAIRQYKKLLDEEIDANQNMQALLGLGRAYKKSDQFSEAITIYQTLIQNHPGELLPGRLPVKAQTLMEVMRLSEAIGDNANRQKAADELIRFLMKPPFPIERTPYYFLLEQCKALNLQIPEQQNAEHEAAIALTEYLHSLDQMSAGLLSPNQDRKFMDSREFPGLLVQSEGSEDIHYAWVLSADQLIKNNLETIFAEINPENLYAWELQTSGGLSESAENKTTFEIAFPRSFPPWTLRIERHTLSGWDRVFKTSQGVLLLVFVFIFLLMIAGLVFMIYTLNQEMRVSKMKSHFISNVSHEFKTPLTSIRHMTEIMHLKRIDSEERREEYLQSMLEQCDHLGHLIENILDFSKIEEDIKNYRFELHQIDEIIKDLIPVFKGRIGNDHWEINLDIQGEPWPMLLDKDAIQQVLFNLLDNAYKYSNGSRKIDLKLLVFHPGLDPGLEDPRPKTEDRNETKDLRLKNEVCLSVRDYGIGISERDLGRIFERFYRGDRLRTEGIKGSGIGLTIVNRIVQAHGGRIEVESEIDKGTTVSVYLPIKSKES